MMASLSKERKCTELPLATGGFSLYGIPASELPAGTSPLSTKRADEGTVMRRPI